MAGGNAEAPVAFDVAAHNVCGVQIRACTSLAGFSALDLDVDRIHRRNHPSVVIITTG